ncbi:hypothetical protein BCD_1596 (plasmid) [Borrelia crocidurae DOU]|uniref:Uncharacterized protein n=1 Tax=Borrelia crocidurae DOU TaxID=1293575 RepID=W5SL55_9SPIR|nr:hypothetical protein BCD_1596 [Borrelia crocidurae DOU]
MHICILFLPLIFYYFFIYLLKIKSDTEKMNG